MSIVIWIGRLPHQRWPWLTMAAVALALELIALYFQHGLKLDPCELCIYERCAMLGLMLAGLVGAIAPTSLLLRLGAFGLWLASSVWGLWLSWGHLMLQLNPPLIPTCASSPEFPAWLPLNQWLPWMFEAYGVCEESSWALAGLSMVQWLVVVFSISLLVAATVIGCQLLCWLNRGRPVAS
ncbi:MAG: disulfide bond formation protein DsbB [Gammaproteobacteria bacterium]|nr:disulfide bond formation protein DsbB [Gammaproteobacteria bacterium]